MLSGKMVGMHWNRKCLFPCSSWQCTQCSELPSLHPAVEQPQRVPVHPPCLEKGGLWPLHGPHLLPDGFLLRQPVSRTGTTIDDCQFWIGGGVVHAVDGVLNLSNPDQSFSVYICCNFSAGEPLLTTWWRMTRRHLETSWVSWFQTVYQILRFFVWIFVKYFLLC